MLSLAVLTLYVAIRCGCVIDDGVPF